MSRWPSARVGVLIVTVLAAIYLVVVFQMAWGFLVSGEPIAIVMGAVLLLFPVLGVIVVARDLQFTRRGNELLERMAAAGELPDDTLPKRPSGRYVREDADADFETWKRGVEEAPDDYRSWVRLALAYRAAGDTPRARTAMRRAIDLDRGVER